MGAVSQGARRPLPAPKQPLPGPDWSISPPLDLRRCREAFAHDRQFTIGVEEELLLVDPDTLALAPPRSELSGLVERDPAMDVEVSLPQLELKTSVCSTAAEATAALRAARRRLIQSAGPDRRPIVAGTYPLTTGDVPLTDTRHFRALEHEYQWVARRACTCGLHVHVALPGADCAVDVHNTVRAYIPLLAALAANSVFVEGRDTGLAAARLKLIESFPRHGIPPLLDSLEDYIACLEWGRRGRALPNPQHTWWDARLHVTNGTLEIRVLDAHASLVHVAALVAVTQALVAWLVNRHRNGERLPRWPSIRIEENRWRALRWGMDGWFLDLESGEPQPIRDVVAQLLASLEPVAAELGSHSAFGDVWPLLTHNGAARQRAVATERGLHGLVAWLMEETAEGLDHRSDRTNP